MVRLQSLLCAKLDAPISSCLCAELLITDEINIVIKILMYISAPLMLRNVKYYGVVGSSAELIICQN